MTDIKQQVREFYDQVGWQEVSAGVYQNASYEDLRPVSRDYIHRCHLRVNRHLKPTGKYLLDAGSGPIQYPEYLTYSQGYRYRVCADISEVALQEARKRMAVAADHRSGCEGLFVVADIANLPFKPGVFGGVVSLHTIHHLPLEEHGRAYQELYRVLAVDGSAVIVNGWGAAPLKSLALGMVNLVARLRGKKSRQADKNAASIGEENIPLEAVTPPRRAAVRGTYVRKHDAAWLEREIGSQMPVRILVWRTFGVKFLRTFVHPRLAGRSLLRCLYWLEERFPRFLGRNGQYPLIVIDGSGVNKSTGGQRQSKLD